ncbi:MAG: hypothetical protein FD153_88 [Rhodospirillaceae bacterium]|nr:MAG: hypothetical protein FD153_88 [Rhodospirillaceae bacterium]
MAITKPQAGSISGISDAKIKLARAAIVNMAIGRAIEHGLVVDGLHRE